MTRKRGLIKGVFATCFWAFLSAPLHAQTVWEVRTGKTVSQKALLNELSKADVVFVGEQHDDPATHRLELALLQSLYKKVGSRLILAMEMWERDEQPALNDYLTGKTDETTFLKNSRPWKNYATDYRPLIEFAKTNHLTVIASNAPQFCVSQVGKNGMTIVNTLPKEQIAALLQAPSDDYRQRFVSVMSGMGGAHGAMDMPTIERFYEAQVLRDETMAESIVRALDAPNTPIVLHMNGDFHSDFGGGIPRRVLWRRSLTRVLTVSVVPTEKPSVQLQTEDRSRADFIVTVQRPARPNQVQ